MKRANPADEIAGAVAVLERRVSPGADEAKLRFQLAILLKRLSKKQRSALVREVDEHAPAIQAWLDRFGGGAMPREASAYMYLTLGVDEIRD